jgi:transposase-like protein
MEATTKMEPAPGQALAGKVATEDFAAELLARADAEGLSLVGPSGLLAGLAKTVLTDIGPIEVDAPRGRAGTFEPVTVRKRQRRSAAVDQMVCSLSAKGLTDGEICAHLREIYGAEVPKETISRTTDRVMEGMTAWQDRPLDRAYPVIFIDAIVAKIRQGQVADRPTYVAIGVTVEGERDIFGL